MEDPYIAILLPLYNGIEFLHQSVASVFNQQCAIKWELIIGVNGHLPNSDIYNAAHKIVADLRTQMMKKTDGASATFIVHILDLCGGSKPPRGKSAALNAMLEAVNPVVQWIALLDADDVWLPNKLATQVPFTWPKTYLTGLGRVYRPAYDVIGTHCEYFGTRKGSPQIPTGDISNANFFEVNPVINSSALIRRDLAHWNSQNDGVEDYDLWLTLWKAGRKFYNCPEKMVMHRIHESSAYNGRNAGLVAGLLQHHRSVATPLHRTTM